MPPLPTLSRLQLQLGDITAMNVEAVVNSTDESLLSGGPVHVAIHRAAGPALGEECENLECPVGEARLTGGHDLSSPYIIHTVAPTWEGGDAGEAGDLASCYLSCLRLAEEHGLRSVAFPSIGSGTEDPPGTGRPHRREHHPHRPPGPRPARARLPGVLQRPHLPDPPESP